jgi:hypothetical protein
MARFKRKTSRTYCSSEKWTRIRPLFKKEFTACSDDKLIIDGLANLAHKPGENPRKFMSRLDKLFNTLHENYASYRIKPERPAPLQPQGTFTEDMLTTFANDSVRAYNKFLLAQVFRAAAPENVVWGMDVFNEYLKGKKFILFMDHKRLEKMGHLHTKTMNRL